MSSSLYLKIAMLLGAVCVVLLFSLVYRLLELPANGQSIISLRSATGAVATAAAPAATPAATATSAPTPASTGITAVAVQFPNVHSAPATGAPVLGVLSRGTQVDVTGRSADTAWLQVRYPGVADGVGWVSTSLMTVNGSTASLPVVQSP